MTVSIGIDPGIGGAIAILCRLAPTGPIEVSKLSPWDGEQHAADLLRPYSKVPQATIFLEKVNAMPGQGLASTWKFAQNYGFYRGLAISLKIPLIDVRPVEWQRGLGLPKAKSKTDHKRNLKDLAAARFPRCRVTLKTADALLIARYGLSQ